MLEAGNLRQCTIHTGHDNGAAPVWLRLAYALHSAARYMASYMVHGHPGLQQTGGRRRDFIMHVKRARLPHPISQSRDEQAYPFLARSYMLGPRKLWRSSTTVTSAKWLDDERQFWLQEEEEEEEEERTHRMALSTV